AGEVGNVLYQLSVDIHKQGGFRAGIGAPGGATIVRGQACIALRADGMADQECVVSCRGDRVRSLWRRDLLSGRVANRAEGASKRESGCEQISNSRNLSYLLGAHCSPVLCSISVERRNSPH